jgi:undecaprenyl diphosphate synthase
MSGNRRWAKSKLLPDIVGHNKGVENMESIVRACFERGVKTASFWAMSTENLVKRPEKEIENLFSLVEKYTQKVDRFVKQNIRVIIVGNLRQLPESAQKACQYVMDSTAHCTGGNMGILFNYGGKWEIAEAVNRALQNKREITPETIQEFLPTSELGDPDLIVRCGKDVRTSGFFSWSNSYSELYFTDTNWPSFNEKELDRSFEYYASCERNFGK